MAALLRIEPFTNRQTAILNELTFATAAARTECLARLSEKGLNRISIHADQSEVEVRVFTLIRAYQRCLDGEAFTGDELQHAHLRAQCFKFRSRMILNFQKLDAAIRAAEIRLPQAALERYRRSGNGENPEEACTVCMCEMEPEEACFDLPCGHSFHVECVTTWLHWNGTCPNCRQSIEDAGAGAGGGGAGGGADAAGGAGGAGAGAGAGGKGAGAAGAASGRGANADKV